MFFSLVLHLFCGNHQLCNPGFQVVPLVARADGRLLGSCAWLVLEAIVSCGLDASLLLSEQERDIRLIVYI